MIALGGMSPRGWLTVYSTVMCTVYMYCTYWDAVPWLVGCTVGDSLMTDEWRTCPSVSAPSVASSAPLPQLTLTSVWFLFFAFFFDSIGSQMAVSEIEVIFKPRLNWNPSISCLLRYALSSILTKTKSVSFSFNLINYLLLTITSVWAVDSYSSKPQRKSVLVRIWSSSSHLIISAGGV